MRRQRAHTALAFMAGAFLAAIVGSCVGNPAFNSFMESGDLRMQVGTAVQFRYDPLECQMGFNRDRREFRMHTDNMSDYVVATLSDIPCMEGQKLNADLEWTTPTDILTRKNISLEVMRIEGSTVWLWSKSGRIGLSIRILE